MAAKAEDQKIRAMPKAPAAANRLDALARAGSASADAAIATPGATGCMTARESLIGTRSCLAGASPWLLHDRSLHPLLRAAERGRAPLLLLPTCQSPMKTSLTSHPPPSACGSFGGTPQ